MPTVDETVRFILQGEDNASGRIATVNQTLADLGTKAVLIETALLAVAGAMAKVAFDASVKYESSLTSLNKVFDGTEEQVKAFTGEMDALAIQYGQNSEALVESLATFKQFGFDIETSAKLVKSALDIVIAGDISTAQATDLLRASLTGFQVDSKDAAEFAQRFANVMNEISNTSAVSFEELAIALSRISPIANQTGLTFEEMTGFLTPALEVFGSGAEVSNAFRTGLLKLVDDAKPVQEALTTLGVAQKEFNGELRPVGDILKDVALKFGDLTESQKLEVAQKLFGIEQTAKLSATFQSYNKVQEVTRQAQQASNEALKETNGLQQEVETRLKSSENVLNSSGEAWRQAARVIGDQYRGELTQVIEALGKVGLALKEATSEGAFDQIFNELSPWLLQIRDAITLIAKNLPEALEQVDFSKLVNAFKDLGTESSGALNALFGEMDLTTAEGLAKAIQGIADSIAQLTTFTAGVIEGLKPFLHILRELGSFILELDPNVVKLGGAIAGLAIGFNALKGPLGLVKDLLPLITRHARALLLGLTGPVGLGIAVGLLAENMYEAWKEGKEVNEVIDRSASVTNVALQELKQLNAEIMAYEQSLGESKETQSDIKAQTDALSASFFEQGKAYNALTGEVRDLTDAELEAKNAGLGWQEALAYGAKEAEKAAKEQQAFTLVVTESGTQLQAYAHSSALASENTKKVEKSMTEAEKASESFRLKMEELASDERIAALEFTASIAVAEIEADAERVKSVMSGLETVFEGTGDVIKDAFGVLALFAESEGVLFGAAGQVFDAAMKQIELENQIRQQAAEDAHALAQAEIRLLELKAEKLASGDALFSVNMDGAEPIMRDLMWYFVKELQLEVNAEALDLVVGVGGTTT